MKRLTIIATACWLLTLPHCFAQGFINLNFESANLAGYSPGDFVPTNAAFPGWIASYTNQERGIYPALVHYDGFPLAGATISITDSNMNGVYGFTPLAGRFSVVLFGGAFSTATAISQTGLIPDGTKTLLMRAVVGNQGFNVSVGGQAINMTILQTFSNYSLYGGDISPFAGQVADLTILSPFPPTLYFGPNMVVVDNIQFSPTAVPEPNGFNLAALGILFLGFRRWHRN